MLNKQASKFLKRKDVSFALGDLQLTNKQVERLNRLFSFYTCKETENMHMTIVHFILNDLTNFTGRYRRLKGIPGTSLYTQVLRYGKKRALEIYKSQSHKKIKKFNNRIEYWVNLGYNLEDSEKLVKDIQKSRSEKSPSAQKGASEYSKRCVGYWIKRGYTEEEAKKAVSQTQSRTHSLERNIRWQNTLKSKPKEEIDLINLKKGHTIESCLARGMDEDTAIKQSYAYFSNRKNFSNLSQVFFKIVDSLMNSDCIYFKTKNYEKQFFGKCVDFYDERTKTVVEFYGDFWHRNPEKYDKNFVCYGKTSQEIWDLDKKRIEIIESHPDVEQVFIVWESEVIVNPHSVAENIIKEINLCKK